MCREEFHLDYEVIRANAQEYDMGKRSHVNRISKMIWTAYEQGHDDGILDAENSFNQMNILLFGKAGNA
jgi:hypothetical protein